MKKKWILSGLFKILTLRHWFVEKEFIMAIALIVMEIRKMRAPFLPH